MTLAKITSHNFDRHRKAVDKIGRALHALDSELKGIARDPQLQPGDRARQEKDARTRAEQTVGQARAALEQALTEDRAAGRYAEDPPAGDALQRRAYWQQQARADLDGRRADEALTLVQQVVESGDHERAREYVRVARPIVGTSAYAAELRAVELDTMPREQKAHLVYAAGVEAVQAHLSWIDHFTGELSARAGLLTEEQRLGWAEAPSLDVSALWKVQEEAEREAVVACERQSAVLDRREPAAWAVAAGRESSGAEQGAVVADGGAGAGGAGEVA